MSRVIEKTKWLWWIEKTAFCIILLMSKKIGEIMKQGIVILMLATVMASPVYAGFQQTSPSAITTIDKVLKMPDESFVTIEGNIIKQIGNEKYLVQSGKSTIIVEIDDELLMNITVTPQNKVRISGEVDKDFKSIELEASKIEIIK